MMKINIWVEVSSIHGKTWKGKLVYLTECSAQILEPKMMKVITVPLDGFSIISIPEEDLS